MPSYATGGPGSAIAPVSASMKEALGWHLHLHVVAYSDVPPHRWQLVASVRHRARQQHQRQEDQGQKLLGHRDLQSHAVAARTSLLKHR
jgi:hypothetical protein